MKSNIKFPIVFVLLMLVVALIFYGMGRALVPMVCAFYAAYLLLPVIRKLENYGIPRKFAALAVLLVVLCGLALCAALWVPILNRDYQQFALKLPQAFDRFTDHLESLADSLGYRVTLDRSHIKTILSSSMSKLSMQQLQTMSGVLGTALESFKGFLMFSLNIFMFPVFFFFLVNDFDSILLEIQNLVPRSYFPFFKSLVKRAHEIFKGYIQGQLLVALCLSIIYCTALSLIGIPFAILIGVLTGILIIIPLVGVALGFMCALIMAVAEMNGFAPVGAVLLVFVCVPLLEQYVLTPRLVGGKVGLTTLETIMAFIVGANLAGFLGMIVAVPCGALLKFLYSYLKEEYFQSEFYN